MQLDDMAKAIGRGVRSGRTAAKLSRKDLAVRADVSERYLHQLEAGAANVSIGILMRVAGALGLDVIGLISGARAQPMSSQGSPLQPTLLQPTALTAYLATLSPPEQEAALPALQAFIRDRRRSSKGLALLGLRGAGKTTIGGLFAKHHGLPFLSVTREIEARAGMPLGTLFDLGGADAYRTLEIEVAIALASRNDRIVLETAGGIAGNGPALDVILGAFTTVWLTATPAEHLARVAGQGDSRPMQGNPKAVEHIAALLAQRTPAYARADGVLETSNKTPGQCLAELEQMSESMFATLVG